MSEVVIRVENLSKQYQLGNIGTGTISRDLNRWWASFRGKDDPYAKIGEVNDRTVKGKSEFVWALKDLNFEVKRGEVVGIIGRNGAGKSTLLKVLSRVTTPTTGKIKVNGRIASLLEVGTGFHPELTGRENIFLNGAILGMTKQEIRSKFEEIVDFTGVERYIDTPVKRYSSGMYVRLAFAVAAFLEPEILIVDEVLAVGDMEFQKKCIGRMKDVSINEGRTVLFVSHDLNTVAKLCTHGILMKNGQISFDGLVYEAINTYLGEELMSALYLNPKAATSKKPIVIASVMIKNETGEMANDFFHDKPIKVEFQNKINDPSYVADLFVMILDSKKRRVFACEATGVKPLMTLTIEPNTLVRGTYSIHAFINVPSIEVGDTVEDVCLFRVFDTGSKMAKHGEYDYGSVFGRYSWS